MNPADEYRVALAAVRELRGTTGILRMLALLDTAIEQWKEQSIGKPVEQVAQLHGAILKARELMQDINRELPDARKRDGGYV